MRSHGHKIGKMYLKVAWCRWGGGHKVFVTYLGGGGSNKIFCGTCVGGWGVVNMLVTQMKMYPTLPPPHLITNDSSLNQKDSDEMGKQEVSLIKIII